MRLFYVAFVICISFPAMSLGLPSAEHSIRLPELPEHESLAFYYWQVMTAHEHGRVVINEDGAPVKIHFAVKIFASEEDAVIVIRDASDHSNCEHLTSSKLKHYNSPSGHSVILKDRIRNTEGQEFDLYWKYNPNEEDHHLHKFTIYLPESTRAHPINFLSLPADNPKERPDMPQAKIAADYFSGTNPNCD